MGHDTDITALGLQDRALFDMQFEKRVHFAGACFLLTTPADPLQLISERFAIRIDAGIGPILRMQPRKNARSQHRRRVACAFFIGEIRHHNRVLRLDAQIIQRPDDL